MDKLSIRDFRSREDRRKKGIFLPLAYIVPFDPSLPGTPIFLGSDGRQGKIFTFSSLDSLRPSKAHILQRPSAEKPQGLFSPAFSWIPITEPHLQKGVEQLASLKRL
jgi:hypothetical protein